MFAEDASIRYIFEWFIDDDSVLRRELSQVGGLPVMDVDIDQETITLRDEKLRSFMPAAMVLARADIDEVIGKNNWE